MPRELPAAALAALLAAGCASPKPVMTVRTVVSPCPAALPAPRCPVWPATPPRTLLDLEAALAQGKAAHAACAATIQAWQAVHQACLEDTP